MGGERFVQLRMPAKRLAFGALTAKPGRTADVLIESVLRRPQRPVFRSIAQVAGASPEELAGLLEALHAKYVAATRVVDGEGGRLVFEIDHERLPHDLFGVLLAFQATFGPVWMHFAQGTAVLRAQAIDCEPEDCAHRLEQALSFAGTKADVSVVELSGPALRTWSTLMAWRGPGMDRVSLAPVP